MSSLMIVFQFSVAGGSGPGGGFHDFTFHFRNPEDIFRLVASFLFHERLLIESFFMVLRKKFSMSFPM